MEREFRFVAGELRAEQDGDKQYLTGYAARFGVLSADLGGFREKIMPGAFSRTLAEQADVRHLKNHDPNLVLGRTKAKTLEHWEDEKGLRFRCLMPDTSYARDLMESVRRGDINECSFGFIARKQAWVEANDPEDTEDYSLRCIRELHDVDLFDTSTVTYPAYPDTSAQMSSRSLFPDGMPAEIAARAKKKKTKQVDGEDLTADCFLIVGDPEETDTWHLPWKFSTEEKTKSHLRDALARFDQLQDVSETVKAKAWKKLLQLCKEHDIDVSAEEEKKSWKLRAELRAELARRL